MNLQDYLLQQNNADWGSLLEDWTWCLPEAFEVWLVNRFGDLFIVQEDGSIWMLDTSGGDLQKVADSRDQFSVIAGSDPDSFTNWFMVGAVDDLVAAGCSLTNDQCYSYRLPPGVGGEYVMENFMVTDLAVHLSVHGQIFGRIKELPDGTKIKFEIS